MSWRIHGHDISGKAIAYWDISAVARGRRNRRTWSFSEEAYKTTMLLEYPPYLLRSEIAVGPRWRISGNGGTHSVSMGVSHTFMERDDLHANGVTITVDGCVGFHKGIKSGMFFKIGLFVNSGG